MNAYDKTYLEDAMENLGAMADYGVNRLGLSEPELWSRFLSSGAADRFGAGAPDIVAGHSGIELACMVMQKSGNDVGSCDGMVSISSPQYWAGWTLAYYQWARGYSFQEMSDAGLNLEQVTAMYFPLHEADISVFVEIADRQYQQWSATSWLKKSRKLNGMTQAELSEKSGVPIRLIRAYEQGTIDPQRAEYRTIRHLQRALHL